MRQTDDSFQQYQWGKQVFIQRGSFNIQPPPNQLFKVVSIPAAPLSFQHCSGLQEATADAFVLYQPIERSGSNWCMASW